VAGLLLARGAARQREIGVRLAMGAGRGRVIRQLLVESLLLALCGAGLGVALAHLFTSRLARMLTMVGNPTVVPYALNDTVLAFALGITVAAALAAGLLPAWQATGSSMAAHLGAGRSAAHGRMRTRWSRALVAGQVALGVLLAAGAVLTVGTLRRLHSEQIGLRTEGVLVAFAEFAPGTNTEGRKGEFEKQAPRMETLRQRLEALPGVRSAALANMSPMSGWMMASTFHSQQHGTGRGMAIMNWVSPGYFETLGTRLVAGRVFAAEDLGAGRRAVVIDEALARSLFPGENPVGREISSGDRFTPDKARVVIGVVEENRWKGPKQNDAKLRGTVWELMATAKEPFRVALARTQGDGTQAAAAVRAALGETMPEMLVTETAKLDQLRDDTIQQERLMAALCSLFGVVALGVIFSGLYGLLAYSVERRVPEIGVRMALGARRADVVRLVSREALTLVGAGLVAGVPLSIAAARLVRALVWQGATGDPWVYVVTAVVVSITGVAASAWPAWRASRVEPGEALRQE
jgi:predicted permease